MSKGVSVMLLVSLGVMFVSVVVDSVRDSLYSINAYSRCAAVGYERHARRERQFFDLPVVYCVRGEFPNEQVVNVEALP